MAETQAVTNYIEDLHTLSGSINSVYASGATTSSAVTGSTVVADNTFSKIIFVTDCNLTSVTSTSIVGSTNIDSDSTFTAGSELIGKITKVKTKVGEFQFIKYV